MSGWREMSRRLSVACDAVKSDDVSRFFVSAQRRKVRVSNVTIANELMRNTVSASIEETDFVTVSVELATRVGTVELKATKLVSAACVPVWRTI